MRLEKRKSQAWVEEVVKPRKRRSKKEKLDLVLSLPSPSTSSIDDEYQGNLDRIGQLMTDLIMWRDVERSSLWFGLGSLFFLSPCFDKGINFSIFSEIPKSDFCFWVLHLSPIQSVKGGAIHDPQGNDKQNIKAVFEFGVACFA